MDAYSLLDASFLQGLFYIKVEQMSEEELEALLAMPSWSFLEALHIACDRKLAFPSSYFVTEEMGYILRAIKGSFGRRNARNAFMVTNESAGITLRISLNEWDDKSINSAEFLEWMINSGLPLPDAVLNKIRIVPLSASFESYWKARKGDFFSIPFQKIRNVPKTRREWIQQNTAVQILLFEKPQFSLTEMEDYCVQQGYIPRGGYEGEDTFEGNLKRVLPKRIRGSAREKKHFSQIELKPLHGVLEEKCGGYADLRELKTICQCIGRTLGTLYPEIPLEKIYHHPLNQAYLSGCHSVIRRMYENWMRAIFAPLRT